MTRLALLDAAFFVLESPTRPSTPACSCCSIRPRGRPGRTSGTPTTPEAIALVHRAMRRTWAEFEDRAARLAG